MTDANQEYCLGGFGARLKAAREALNLTQKDAAVRLHLNPNILQILESENFQKAPPATFIRGYLRSYARLLNFNEDDINAALTQSGLESQTRTPIVHHIQVETMQSDRHVQWFSTIAVLGLFIFVGIWWSFHSSSTNNNTLARSAQPATPAVAPPPSPVAEPLPPSQPVAQTVTAPVATTTPAPPATPTAQPEPILTPAVTATTTAQPEPATTVVAPEPKPTPAPLPTPNTTLPVMANTPPNVIPYAPGVDPLALPAQPTHPTVVHSETSKKRSPHHKQHGTVSGFSMALPEPGL